MTVERLHRLIQEQSDRLRQVEQENRRFQDRLQVCIEELGNVQQTRRIVGLSLCGTVMISHLYTNQEEERGLQRQRSMKFELAGTKSAYSPTKAMPDVVSSESPHPSPSRAEHEVPVRWFYGIYSMSDTIFSHTVQDPLEKATCGIIPAARAVLWIGG
jgi:hypothetical protein